MQEVLFYNPDYLPGRNLSYVIIGARFNNKWLFVKHKKRNGYELPAGHIRDNELPDEAAGRELNEETGADIFNLECIATYSVTNEKTSDWGKLYYADIIEIGPRGDDDEIADVMMMDDIPGKINFPGIQSKLFYYLKTYLVAQQNNA